MADLFDKMATENLRKDVIAKRAEGCICPVCDQMVKVYKRTINSTMARQLIKAYTLHKQEWFHTRDIVLDGTAGAGDFAKLEDWGLIKAELHTPGDEGKRTSGNWQITDNGVRFIKRELVVPQYCLFYNGEMIKALNGHSDPHISIREALGKKFDYNDLMNS